MTFKSEVQMCFSKEARSARESFQKGIGFAILALAEAVKGISTPTANGNEARTAPDPKPGSVILIECEKCRQETQHIYKGNKFVSPDRFVWECYMCGEIILAIV